MVVKRDIVGISIPFAAGACCAALLSSGGGCCFLAAGAGCTASIVILLLFCRRDDHPALAMALFYSLGCFCFISSSIAGGNATSSGSSGRALRVLTRAIENCGFGEVEGLIKALMTGVKDGLDSRSLAAFRAAGAFHILALSGLHLGVIYGILRKSLLWMGRSRTGMWTRSLLTIVACGFYVWMTGAGASITRAFLFILFNEAAVLMPGRKKSPVAVLSASLTIQLAVSPLMILTPGFQLSYLAMLGIYLVYPRLRSWYSGGGRMDIGRKIWDVAAMSISCQLFTAPVAWLHFRSFPVFFLLTNLICLPLTGITIWLAVLTIILNAVGCCPGIIRDLAGQAGQIILYSLDVIASIS